MKKLLVIALVFLPWSASADFMDVIQLKLKDSCSVDKYRAIAKDFNEEWGKKHGYRAEIAVALHNDDLDSIFWLGRTANAEAFGKAWDTWRDERANPMSVAAKLQTRFNECGDNVSRSSFDVY